MTLHRALCFGITFVTALLFAPAPQAQDQWRRLLGPQQITKDITLSKVEEAKGEIIVLLDGQPTCEFRNLLPRRLSDMPIQVWLLQGDGTALTQERRPSGSGWMNGGCKQNPIQFYFRAGSADPVGLAVSIDRALTVIEIH